jgi:hypothetical protein
MLHPKVAFGWRKNAINVMPMMCRGEKPTLWSTFDRHEYKVCDVDFWTAQLMQFC